MKKLILLGICFAIGLVDGITRPAISATNPAPAALGRVSVVEFSGSEGVSQPFSFEVVVESPDQAMDFSYVVGRPASLTVAPGRVISGMIERVEQLDGGGARGLYRIHLVPSLNRLKYRSTSRTFYERKPVDVAVELLNEAGVANVDSRLAGSYSIKEITVQYRESDFAFVSRLLEEAGVHYHFETTAAGDKIVLSDGNAGFPISPIGKVAYSTKRGPSITSFTRGQSLHSGSLQAGDYNWKTPTTDLTAGAQIASTEPTASGKPKRSGKTPLFTALTEREFPASVEGKAESQVLASIRLAARVAEGETCEGESTYAQLEAGQRVMLTGHPRPDFNQEYIILAVTHEQTEKGYRNTFRCLPSQVPYRPPLVTPPSLVAGVVSGIVVGPPGETKHVDQFGRVKVRFPWRSPLHSAQADPGDAGFVRVAQIAAGVGSAALWLPDVGDEVLVAFEYGDPDRPVVVGSLYNAKDMPPVALPNGRHVSLFRQQSIINGPNGPTFGPISEVAFDGTPGAEQAVLRSGPSLFSLRGDGAVAMTAGTAMQVQVGTDLIGTVGRNTSLESGNNLLVKAGQNYSAIVGRDAQLTVGEDLAIQTGKSFVTQSGGLFKFVTAQTGTIDARDGLFLSSPALVSIQSKDISVKASANLIMKGSKITQN